MDFRADQRQQQTLSPKLQHAVRLLQLSSLDFAQEVSQALGRNPFLESEDSDDEAARSSVAEPVPEPGAADDGGAEGDSDRDMWQADGLGSRQARRRRRDQRAGHDGRTDLAGQHLHGQLPCSRCRCAIACSPGHRRVARRRRLPAHAAGRTAGAGRPDPAADRLTRCNRAAARAVARAGRRGRAQRRRMPAACNCRRSNARGCASSPKPSSTNILTGWPRKRRRRAGARARAGAGAGRSRLRPHPPFRPAPGLALTTPAQRSTSIPDVIVRKVRGQWTVQLNPAVIPRVRLNQVYAELFQRHARGSAERRDGERTCRKRSWTMRNVEQRFSTILDVARGDRAAPEALPRFRRDGDEAAGSARDRRRAGHARIDRLARHQQQVHGHAASACSSSSTSSRAP